MAAETSLSPAARLVRRHDRDRFLTALFAPADRREDLFALYAFNYEIAKTREVVSEPALGRIRLQWWRESIEAIYAGGAVRRHEVVEPLAAAVRRHHLSRALVERLIGARELDLLDEPPATMAALEAYAEDSSATLVQLALEILGVQEGAAMAAAREVGIAYALAGLLRASPFHARAKRLFLPADRMAATGLEPYRTLFELKSSPALTQVAAEIATVAREHLAAARARRREVPRSAVPALLPAVIAERSLDRLGRASHDPLDRRFLEPDPRLSWRLALAAALSRY